MRGAHLKNILIYIQYFAAGYVFPLNLRSLGTVLESGFYKRISKHRSHATILAVILS